MPPAKRSPSSSSSSAKPAAKRTSASSRKTAAAAESGAEATATTARSGAGTTKTTAKRAATTTRRASGGSETPASAAEQLVKGAVKPRDLVMLTRERIQETLDEAAARGRVTRKDANDLVAELVRRGRHESHDLLGEIEELLGRGTKQLESATKRARSSESVDRLVRGADRARRVAGVGPSFPILGYDELNASQVQSRLSELKKPELRKVLTYERNNSNRKSVVGALEKAIG
jgi:polyhydroxyalkanoate synthesis regulator phasin